MTKSLKAYHHRFWNSPTLMTWLSYSTKALSLFIVLPLILKQFTPAEISLWYLFSSIFVLLGLADMGFRQTFVRIISYAMAGAEGIQVYKTKERLKESAINWKLLERIYSIMKLIYKYLSGVLFILMISIGTYMLMKPISLVENQENAWIAWGVIIVSNVVRFYGTIYQNYLEGLNKIALVRKIESFMSLGSIITSIIVLLLKGDILALVIANQIWLVLNVVRNWFLSRAIEDGQIKFFKNISFDKILFKEIWQPAWRSGISGFMSNGLTHLSGILYAQIGDPKVVAAYLLALKLMTQIKEISMAPFYSKIPYLSRLRAEGKITELVKIAQRGMFLSHSVFVVGVVLVGLFSNYLLGLINSNIEFVSSTFWTVFLLAFFVHRYGAMHMQVYLSTNHVISHIADGVSGMLYIISALVLSQYVGIYAIPLGMLTGYLGFYAWYAASYSIKSLSVSFWMFEKRASLIPLIIMLVYILFNLQNVLHENRI